MSLLLRRRLMLAGINSQPTPGATLYWYGPDFVESPMKWEDRVQGCPLELIGQSLATSSAPSLVGKSVQLSKDIGLRAYLPGYVSYLTNTTGSYQISGYFSFTQSVDTNIISIPCDMSYPASGSDPYPSMDALRAAGYSSYGRQTYFVAERSYNQMNTEVVSSVTSQFMQFTVVCQGYSRSFYLNGTLRKSDSNGGTYVSPSWLTVGWTSWRYWEGSANRISAIRYYHLKALTAQEIQRNYDYDLRTFG